MNINSWILWIVGGAYLFLLGALAILLVINADLRATVAADDAAKSLLLAQNKVWAEKMSTQNAALEKIKAVDAANAKAIAKAQKIAASNAEIFAQAAASIANAKFSGSDCDQVTALDRFYWSLKP